jgi:2,5-diketo-D-gluconate reductase A
MDIQTNVKLHSGGSMPVIGLGTWGLKGDIPSIVMTALAAGYRMIDTSSDYGSQSGIGEALALTDIPRSELYIVTKVEETDDAYKRTLQNLEELQLEYIDLMLIHRPPQNGAGEELWQGLIRAQKQGLVRDIGVSNYSEQQIQSLVASSGVYPVVNQIEWSPFGWSAQMLEFCEENDIVIQAYSPLTHDERLNEGVLQQMGEKYGKTPAQILVRWSLQMGLVPLPKSDNPTHIQENVDVFDFSLSSEDMEELRGLNEDFSALADKPIYQKNRKESIYEIQGDD